MLLVSVDDRAVFISVGAGVTGVMTDEKIQQIISGMRSDKLNPDLSQLNPDLSQLNPNLSQLNPNLSQLNPNSNPNLSLLNPNSNPQFYSDRFYVKKSSGKLSSKNNFISIPLNFEITITKTFF